MDDPFAGLSEVPAYARGAPSGQTSTSAWLGFGVAVGGLLLGCAVSTPWVEIRGAR